MRMLLKTEVQEQKSDEAMCDFPRLKPKQKETVLKIMDCIEQDKPRNTSEMMYQFLMKKLPIDKRSVAKSVMIRFFLAK